MTAHDDEAHDRAAGAARPPRGTRRLFLKGAGGLLAAGAAGVAGYLAYDRWQHFGRDATRTVRDHRVAQPAGVPRMVIVRGGTPAQNARAALARLGGLAGFVTPGDVVVVKPNMGWDSTPAQAANTHPDVVAEVVRACRDARARRIIVTDCPTGEARRAFVRSGILRAAREAGAEVVLPEESRHHPVRISGRLGVWNVLEPFVEATKIINVPIGKHHSFTGFTGGMKNWLGITAGTRMLLHADIQRAIAEFAALMRPTLTIMDASRVLMRNGPVGGNLDDVRILGALAASTDPVALDAWGCGLLDTPEERRPAFLALGEALGLGRADYRSLAPVEITAG